MNRHVFSLLVGFTLFFVVIPAAIDRVYARERLEQPEDFMPMVTPEEDAAMATLSPRAETMAKILGIRSLVNELFF